MVEEDVFVTPDFFQWHWQTHTENEFFVTCGRRYGRMPADFYSNPGTCYRREAFSAVIPHICDDYFKDNAGYLNTHFPESQGMDGMLDDGLIRKSNPVGGGQSGLC